MSTSLTTIDLDQTIAQIEMLATYFGYELEPVQQRIYVDGLRDIPADDLRAGCRRVILTSRFFPKVAEIRAAVDAELRDRRVLEAPPTNYAPDQRHCYACQDTGWTGEGLHEPVAPGVHPVVRRCPCYQTNPVLARQRGPAKYDKAE